MAAGALAKSWLKLQDIKVNAQVIDENALRQRAEDAEDIRRRLLDIGLVEGTDVSCLQKSPAGDPVAYLIRGAVIAIRSEDSSQIVVEGLLN